MQEEMQTLNLDIFQSPDIYQEWNINNIMLHVTLSLTLNIYIQ